MGISNNFINPSGNIGNIDLTGITGLNTSYRHFKEGFCKLNPDEPLIIVPATPTKVNREIIINFKEDLNPSNTNNVNLYFGAKNQHPKPIELGGGYLDSSDGGIALIAESSQETILEVTIRQDTEILYTIGNYLIEEIGDELMIPVNVRLAVGTGINYIDIGDSHEIYDEGAIVYDQDYNEISQGSISAYQNNLRQLKDSDSSPPVTGYKLFDIDCFYPGKLIDFDVVVDSPSQYGSIHIQLFDPLTVGEVLFAIANDVVNLDVGDLSVNFVGALTRNAWYKDVINNQVGIRPNFSHHVGRFVAQNINNNNAYDTVIIKSYTPNENPLLGGTFTLTGKF